MIDNPRDPQLYLAIGSLYKQMSKPDLALPFLAKAQLYAVVGAPGVLHVVGNKTLILRDRNFNPIWRRPAPFTFRRFGRDARRLSIGSCDAAWPLGRVNRLVLIDNNPNAPRLFVQRLGLPDPGQPMREPGLIEPGQTWSVQLSLPAKTVLTVEDAPADLRYDEKARRLTWAVPRTTPAGDHLVLVSVREPEQDEHYFRYHVRVRVLRPTTASAS